MHFTAANWQAAPVQRPLLLLDAASMYFRAFYGVPDTVTAPDGTPVNAVRGFLDMTTRLIEWRSPARLVACLDLDWRPAFRVAAIPSYKAHRVEKVTPTGQADVEEVPDLLAPQVPVLLDVLAAVGIATAGAEGYEADDVMGTLAAREHRDPVEVASGDRDMFQVVRTEPTPTLVIYLGRGLAKAEVLGPTELAAKYGLPVEGAGPAYADMAALRGDPSDGLPGVPGVGEKTAATLIGRFGSVEGLLAAVDDPASAMAGGPRSKLRAARDYLEVAPAVVRVATDADVHTAADDALPAEPVDPDALAELAQRWGLESPIERMRAALAANA